MQPLATALVKRAEGKYLTGKESRLIENSRYGQRVANEIDPGKIRSGEFSSKWTENINTEIINAEEYGRLVEAAQIKTATDTLADALQSLRTQDNVQAQAGSQTEINEPAVNTAPQTGTAESLEEASRKYGDGAKGFIATYQQGQDIDKYESAYDAAYSMGHVNVPKAYLAKSPATAYLTETQREIAYIAGQAAGAAAAEANDAGNKANANGKRRRRTGAVKGENLKFSEMNKQQRLAYRVLSKVAAVTGVDIVLYKSEVGADGKYAGAQGEYRQSEPGTLRIDINAGLLESMDASDLSNYAMLRTFSHEFTHFIEKWDAKGYNELREAVFRTLEQNGENVEDLIDAKLGKDTSGKMTYDGASREVVAEAMTDIFPDANFVEELATKHKNIFERLLDRLKAFVADIKEYYKTLGANRSVEANALKETVNGAIKYLDSIVNLFDRVAVEAVETFQSNHAIDEAIGDNKIKGSETKNENKRRVAGDSESVSSERSGRGNSEDSRRNDRGTAPSIESEWGKLGRKRQSEAVKLLEDYAIGNSEFDGYLRIFTKEAISDSKTRKAAIENMAEAFYNTLSNNRILTENDPRFRWLGDDLSSFIEDIEGIKNKSTSEQPYKETARPEHVQYQLRGYNSDNIEVYETSDEVKALPWSERRKRYLDLMINQYKGKKARFVKKGRTYYAEFDRDSIRKPIYGDKRASKAGRDALINAGADGDVFNLVENSRYKGSSVDTKNHKNTDYFDYFIKTVQIDGRVFDLHADVKKQYGVNDGYIYTLFLEDNNTVKASPAQGTQMVPFKSPGNAFTRGNIPQSETTVNGQAQISLGEDVQYQSRGYLETEEAASFANDIDGWDKDGRPAGETFILGSTGEVMQGLGAIESDIYMHGDKINEILAEHPEMSLNEIQRIPEMLNDPVLIIKSKNFGRGNAANSRLVIFGAVKAQDGRPVMSVLDLRPVENRLLVDNMQKVTSAYTKDSNPVGFISKSEILYADKKRTPYLLKAIGFQMPITCTQSGFIGNISYKQRSVNIKGAQFTEVFETADTQTQERSAPLTNREVLEYAASELGKTELTEGERGGLEIFKKHLDKLKGLHEQRDELGRLYKEQQFGKGTVNRAEAQKTLNNMKTLDGMIEKESNKLLEIENKPVLKKILEKSRKIIETEERTHGQELLRRYRARRAEAADVAKYRRRVKTEVDTLSKWILHPDNKNAIKHIPDAIKSSVIPFISGIDFTSKQQLRGGEATKADIEFVKKLNAVKNALTQNQDIYGMYSGYNDLPPDFPDKLQSFIDTTQELINNNSGEYVINRMTAAELKSLAQVVTTLKKFITQMNRFHQNAMFKHAFEAGDSSMEFMKPLSPAKHTGTISNFVLWQQIRPAYAFERFGKGGTAIYNELREAQGKLAFNTNEVIAFAERVYTTEEVKSWEKDTKTFELGGDTVIMPIANIMSFYELSKRPQAMKHILSEGIRVATFKHGLKEKISDVGHTLTEEDIKTIIGSLTPRQVEVADALQKFMSEKGGEWGNYVSMARFGEELFGEKEYFPIHSDNRRLKATAEETPSAASLYALLNMGFTKELNEKADNRILLYSIFDVFSNHMASMAQYNAFALPVLDTLKWFNYQRITIAEDGTKTKEGSVREEMARAFGTPEETNPGSGNRGYAESFVINMIKALNGTEAQGIPSDAWLMKMLRKANIAQIAYNARVVVQQPMAITRAGMYLDADSLAKATTLVASLERFKAAKEEMLKYSGIAVWKVELGFYDINISRGLSDRIKHDATKWEKYQDFGMKGAEFADTMTWTVMWEAAKIDVARRMRRSDPNFLLEVSKKFDEVIYKTQVVDSILTKTEYSRSQGFGARLVSSFMSEPIATASMLVDAYWKHNEDIRRGLSKEEAWVKNRDNIIRTATVYIIGQVFLAAVQAVEDALRDDDDYQTFLEKWGEAFGGNLVDELMPFNKIPYLADLWELAKSFLEIIGVDTYGNDMRAAVFQWSKYALDAAKILQKKLNGDKTNYKDFAILYKALQAASAMTGISIATPLREAIVFINNTAGQINPNLKIKTYEASETAQIKYAYKDGYLTAEEATELLLEKKLVEDENAAYWKIAEWDSDSDNYSRYDNLLEAVKNGAQTQEAIDDLVSHGVKIKDVYSRIRKEIRGWYREGEISRIQAYNMLTAEGDMEKEKADESLRMLDFEIDTGLQYDEIKESYLSGELTRQEIINAYTKYGKIEAIKANEMADKLDFIKLHPELDGIRTEDIVQYNTYIKGSGISDNVYIAALKYKGQFQGDIQGPTVEYINKLNLTPAQKDALFLALGWSKRNLRKMPWR